MDSLIQLIVGGILAFAVMMAVYAVFYGCIMGVGYLIVAFKHCRRS